MAPLGEPLHDEFGLKMMSTSPCGEVIIREHLLKKRMFSFGHCPNYLSPLPPPLLSGNLYIFFWTSKPTFCEYDRKNTNYHKDGPMIIMMVF